MAIDLPTDPLINDLDWCLTLAKAPVRRTMSRWAEETIWLPNGPFGKERYRHYRHPVSRPFFDELDSGRWSRVASTGPVQNGKTLMCYVIPVLYHLFEVGETVIVGLPSMDMANDKWREDFLPVIEASEYAGLLPLTGEGSRGGQVKRSIKFRNGQVMRFMTAGGNDKQRAGFTSRVVAITEADGMDTAAETSREADKIEQIEARTSAFGRTGKQVYLECTVSFETGRIWQEIQKGSQSRLVRPCPYCHDHVSIDREHLKGWEDAENEEHAAQMSHFVCPSCEAPWTDEDRVATDSKVVMVHGNQTVGSDGTVHGDLPMTQTFGFRWSAIDNPFVKAGDLGAQEWLAKRDRDRENAEKKMRQFVWALPYISPQIDMTPLEAADVERRTGELKKGIVPEDATAITVGIDTGKRALHWTAMAITPESGLRVIEYGLQPVDADRLGIKRGLVEALDDLAAYFFGGWQTTAGRRFTPSQVWIDSGYHQHTDPVYEFCGAANEKLGLPLGAEVYRPTKGYGEGQRNMTRYISPDGRKSNVLHVGTQFHIATVRRNGITLPGVMLVHMNTDHWKSETHQRLAMPESDPLAISLYDAASENEHVEFSEHLTAEKQIEKYVKNRGEVVVWDRIRRQNHWLDATYSALCASEATLMASQTQPVHRKPQSLREMAGQA